MSMAIQVTLAGSNGSVAALDGSTGTDQWRASVTGGIAGGIGSDGRISAVVTRGNELLALKDVGVKSGAKTSAP